MGQKVGEAAAAEDETMHPLREHYTWKVSKGDHMELLITGKKETHSMSGQLSGLSKSPPSMTKRSTCSLDMPWYGCSAKVAISHSTTPNDLQ